MGIDSLEIRKVDKDTELAERLLDFVENFSWEEVKEHTVMMIKQWKFTDWETLFAAIADGKIMGMASFMKTDYYPLPEIYPVDIYYIRFRRIPRAQNKRKTDRLCQRLCQGVRL